jgi:hypothetical protein
MIQLNDLDESTASAVLESARAMRSSSNGGRFAFRVKFAFPLAHPSMADCIEHLLPGAVAFAEHFERLPSSGASMKTRVSEVGGMVTLITENGRHLVTTEAVISRIELTCKRRLEVAVEMVLLGLDAGAAGSFLRLTKNVVDVLWRFVPPQQVDLLEEKQPSAARDEDEDDGEHGDEDGGGEGKRVTKSQNADLMAQLTAPADPHHLIYVEQINDDGELVGGTMTVRPENGVIKVSDFGTVHALKIDNNMNAMCVYARDVADSVRDLLGQAQARFKALGVEPSWLHPAMQGLIKKRCVTEIEGSARMSIERDDVGEGGLLDRLIKAQVRLEMVSPQ